MTSRRLQVLIEEDQWRRLGSAATERVVSVATVVREAIDARVPGGTDEPREAAADILRAEAMSVPDPGELRRELDELRAPYP